MHFCRFYWRFVKDLESLLSLLPPPPWPGVGGRGDRGGGTRWRQVVHLIIEFVYCFFYLFIPNFQECRNKTFRNNSSPAGLFDFYLGRNLCRCFVRGWPGHLIEIDGLSFDFRPRPQTIPWTRGISSEMRRQIRAQRGKRGGKRPRNPTPTMASN